MLAVADAGTDDPEVDAEHDEVRRAVVVRVDDDVELLLLRRRPTLEGVDREHHHLFAAGVERLHARGTQIDPAELIVGALEAPGIEVGGAGNRTVAVLDVGDAQRGMRLQGQVRSDVGGHARHHVVGHAQRDAAVRGRRRREGDEARHIVEGVEVRRRVRQRAAHSGGRNRQRHVDARRAVLGDRDRGRAERNGMRRSLLALEAHAETGRRPVVLDLNRPRFREIGRDVLVTEVDRRFILVGEGVGERADGRRRVDRAGAGATGCIVGQIVRVAAVDDRRLDGGGLPLGMRLDRQRGGSRHVRRGHRRPGKSRGLVAGADQRRDDGDARRRDVGLQQGVGRAWAARSKGPKPRRDRSAQRKCDRQPIALNQREAVGRGTRGEPGDAVEGNAHDELLAGIRIGGDGTLERRQATGVVDHHHRRGAGLLAEDGARDARAGPALGHHEFAGDVGVHVLLRIAAEADRAVRIAEHDDGQRARAECRVVGVDRPDGLRGRPGGHCRQGDIHGRIERLFRAGGDRDPFRARARRAEDVADVAGVARRRDDDDAGLHRIVGRQRVGGIRRGEVGAERHVDHVHVVVHRPVQRLGDDIGRALAAEDAHGIEVGFRRDARPDRERVVRERVLVVGARVHRAGRVHPEARGAAGDVRAVTVAVEGIGIGDR